MKLSSICARVFYCEVIYQKKKTRILEDSIIGIR